MKITEHEVTIFKVDAANQTFSNVFIFVKQNQNFLISNHKLAASAASIEFAGIEKLF